MTPFRRSELPPRAADIFVNRQGPLAIFERAAFAIPAEGAAICVFDGIGGQGKTALCRELFKASDKAREPTYDFLRRAMVDLHGRPKTDPDLLLVWIRNGFAAAGVALPAFDLALAIAWEATRGEQPFPVLTNAWLARTKDAIGEVSGDAVQSVRELVEETAETIPGLGASVRLISRWVLDKGKRTYLERTRPFLKELYRDGALKEPYELSELLAWFLAQDLNHHTSEHPRERLVLFVDEYERVFDEGGAGARWKENPFDAHLRTLIAETNGLLAVIFSRERLPWARDPDWRAMLEGRQHLLGGLADEDAERWLQRVPIDDEAIRAAIVVASGEGPEASAKVYPLMLDLHVEHWRGLSAKKAPIVPACFNLDAPTFEGRLGELVQRLLRDYRNPLQKTLERLSVANRFDREAFAHVVHTFATGLPLDSYDDLAELSFMTRSEDGFLVPHRAVAEAIAATLTEERRRTSIEALFAHYEARATVSGPREVTDQAVNALVEAASLRRKMGMEGYVGWLSEIAHPVLSSGRYLVVERLWREALAACEDLLGPDHPDTATSVNNVAYCLNAQGRYVEAGRLHRKALEIRQRVLGPDHPSTAASVNNVASCLGAQGRHDEAEPLLRKALEISERVLGPDHPDTAASVNNLASCLGAQRRHGAAERLYRKALEISERVLGSDHPNTATSINNLASCLDAQGRHGAAERLYRKALEISERVLGPDHPSTATSVNNLASCLNAQGGRHGEAEPLLREALEIRERVLGSDPPDTAASVNNLASCLDDQGRHGEAEPLYRKALEIRQRVLGPDHPSTAASVNNLASCLNAQGRHGEAEPLHREALEIRERVLGSDHPDTAASVNNLASCLDDQGRHGEAEPLYRKALEIRQRVLGPDHPSTRTVANNLRLLLEKMGKR